LSRSDEKSVGYWPYGVSPLHNKYLVHNVLTTCKHKRTALLLRLELDNPLLP